MVGVRGPRTGYFVPGCEWWAGPGFWRRLRLGLAAAAGGDHAGKSPKIPKSFSFVFRRMWTNSGRFLRHFDRPDLTVLFRFKKINGFSTFSSPGGSGGVGGLESKIPKSKNSKSRNPKIPKSQNPENHPLGLRKPITWAKKAQQIVQKFGGVRGGGRGSLTPIPAEGGLWYTAIARNL